MALPLRILVVQLKARMCTSPERMRFPVELELPTADNLKQFKPSNRHAFNITRGKSWTIVVEGKRVKSGAWGI